MKIARGIVMVVVVGLMASCYTVKQSTEYFGVETLDKNVVFVLDISGSMEGKDEGNLTDQLRAEAAQQAAAETEERVGGIIGEIAGSAIREESTKLGTAKRELIPAINGLTETSMFTVITFGDAIETWRSGMVEASQSNRSAAAAGVKQLESRGGTPAMASLEAAFSLSDVDIIFFLTDGQPSDAGPDEIVARVEELNEAAALEIHTVGLGDDQNERFLRQLASANGGTYSRK